MISVIIPCYNYGRYLGESIESALAQVGPGFAVEVIVVDDGSTDHTREVAAVYGDRIRYLYQENLGLSAARNAGMAEARHELVTFLDADDCLTEGALARLTELWDSLDPKPGVLGSRHREVDEKGIKAIYREPPSNGEIEFVSATDLVVSSRFSCTVIANRKLLTEIGGFDTNLKASEDRDLWIRVAATHPIVLVNYVTLLRRNHGANISRAAVNQTATMERVLEKAFSNPQLDLKSSDRRYARAVCHYQSALMFADAGDHLTALSRMTRSFLASPFGRGDSGSIPSFGRIRGFASLIIKVLRGSR